MNHHNQLPVLGREVMDCSYGENRWQTPASFYTLDTDDPLALDKFKLIAGEEPSYNNLCDLDRLLQTITHIAAAYAAYGEGRNVPFIAVACKHGNACGVGVSGMPNKAICRMIEGDPRAIFGGLVITNIIVEDEIPELLLAYQMTEGQRRLLDGIIAPIFSEVAVKVLRRKSDKCRLLANEALYRVEHHGLDQVQRFRYVRGGFLTQPNYTFVLDLKSPELEKIGQATTLQEIDLLSAWAIGSTSNSNTVTLFRDGMLIGNGVGQQDRVTGCKLAIGRALEAGHDPNGAVAYSDSYFPFPDGPEVLIEHGIKAILASSGSVNDEKIKALCRQNGVPLYLIPDALGRGFFGH